MAWMLVITKRANKSTSKKMLERQISVIEMLPGFGCSNQAND